MIDFGLWSLQAAKAYRDAYAEAIPVRESWLAEELLAHGRDPDMLNGPARLPELWAWSTALIDTGPTSLRLRTSQLTSDPQPGIRPPWHDQGEPSQFLSDGALWLIELLGAHLATLIMAVAPEARWEVYRAPRSKHDIDQHTTKLFGTRPSGVDPSGMVYGPVIGHVYHGKSWDRQEDLDTLYNYAIEPQTTT